MSGTPTPAPDGDSVANRLTELRGRFACEGQVHWIGLRPARDVPMQRVTQAEAVAGGGLVGDRYAGTNGKRGVTLIQAEHLPVLAALVGLDGINPATLRRNVLVAGCNLLALVGQRFRLGTVLLEGTGPCEPCERMEKALGDGGYSAMIGHGGITARVLESGTFALGDVIQLVTDANPA